MKLKFYPGIAIFICCLLCIPMFGHAANPILNDLSKIPCSISIHQQSLQSVFEKIEAQTSYSIICIDKTGMMNKKVSLNAPNSTVQKVLSLLAAQTPFAFKAEAQNIIIQTGTATNNALIDIEIKGKVTDAQKAAIPGVSIMIKNKQKGTTSNGNGDFQIKANEGDILVFSSLGYLSREVPVISGSTYQIVLQDDQRNLSEVVVTALGIKKEKAKLGYAVQEVKGEDLVKAREPNLVSSMTGKVAGLTILNSSDLFQNPTISLRGRTPLIVIDGIPDQSADLFKINADDVESMSVLKGASASALYGSIGANGAIMITTKRGSSKDLSIDVNSSTQFQPSFIRIPKVQTTYGNGFKGKYTYIDGSGSGPEGSGWIWGPKLDQRVSGTPSGYFETPQFNSPIDPVTGKLVPLPFLSRGKDNIKNFFQTGVISSNNISFTKAGENGSFRASASHIYQRGIVPNTDLKNTSFNISGNYNLSKSLTMNARISYNKEYTKNFPETGYGPTNYLYNLVLWTGPDIDVRDLRNYWMPGKEGVQQRHYNTSYYNNPYFQAYEYLRGYDKDNTFSSLDLNYQINPELSAKLRTGVNTFGLNRSYSEPKSYIGYGNKSKGQYTNETGNYFDIVTDLTLDYNHTFTNNFKIHAQAGGSNYYRNEKYARSSTDGLNIPGFYNLSNSIKSVIATNGLEERRTSSIYGLVDLEFYKALFVSVTGRNDIVSTLPTQSNSFFYPSLTTSLLISELVDMPQWMSFLKARGSVSRVSSGTLQTSGNDNYTYRYLPSYNKGVIWENTPSLSYGDALSSKNLTPQTSDSWEVGVETKLFGNRISLDATYYQTKDFNNIVSIPFSIASGYASKLENGNVYQRKGLEFILSGSPVKAQDFRWNVSANISKYHRYLKEIYGGGDRLNGLKVGDRTDMILTSVYQKDPSGNIIHSANGFPLDDTFKRSVGYSDPDWVYGVENTFNYKNISLRFLVDGRLGGKMFSTTNQKMWWGGTHPGTVNQFREDANNNQSTYIGKGVIVISGTATYDANGDIISDTRTFAPNTLAVNYIDYMTNTSNGANNNYNYFSQSFLKLREVTLTYQVKAKWLEKSFIRGADFSVVGRNLLLISKMPNVDPDSGVDNLQTPSTRSIGFNVNLKF